jgi:hypothetical protein
LPSLDQNGVVVDSIEFEGDAFDETHNAAEAMHDATNVLLEDVDFDER